MPTKSARSRPHPDEPSGQQPARPRSLADDLRARSDESLGRLLDLRPDLVHPVPADLGQLVVRATTATSMQRAMDRLDAGVLTIAEALAALPDPATSDQVIDGLPGAEPDVVMAAIRGLWERALLWSDDGAGLSGGLHLVRGVRDVFGPYPGGLGPSFAEQRRAVAKYAADPEALDAILGSAPPEANSALEALQWGPPIGRVRHPVRPNDPAEARTPIQWLLAHDLLVVSDTETVTLPREVAIRLRGGALVRSWQLHAPQITGVERETTLINRTAGQHAFTVVRLVEELLESWSTAPPTVMRAGGLTVRDLSRTAALLDIGEPDAALIIEIAYAAGLLAADGEINEAFLPTPAYDGWRARSTAQRWGVIAAAWLDTTRAPGLVGARVDGGARINSLSKEVERPAVAELRGETVSMLADLPRGLCPTPDSLLEQLRWRRPRRATPARETWVRDVLRESEFLGITGLGALSDHGRELLQLRPSAARSAAASRERGPDRLEIPHALGEHLDAVLPALVDHILIQADLTAVAPGPLTPELARRVNLVAEVESTGAATVFRFTEASVRRGLDSGHPAAELISWLSEASITPLPQPLSYLIEDIARRHGTIRVGVATSYLRSDDDTLLSSMISDRRLVGLRLNRIASTVLVSDASPDIVLATLREAGLTPMAEAADGAIVVRRPDSLRTPPRVRPLRVGGEPTAPDPAMIGAAVRALRAGDRALAARPDDRSSDAGSDSPLGTMAAGDIMGGLRRALEGQRPVWIGYADVSGTTSDRVVEPLRLDGGFLTAFDTRTEEVRTFTVARITGVAEIPHDNDGKP